MCLWHENLGKHEAASYKYCKVMRAMPDQDGLVRKAVIKYFNIWSKRAKQRKVDICQRSLLPSVNKVQWDCPNRP